MPRRGVIGRALVRFGRFGGAVSGMANRGEAWYGEAWYGKVFKGIKANL